MTEWASFHIFRRQEPDALLRGCLVPALDRWRARGWVKQAFFLRYWQGGPHLRLRMQPVAQHATRLRDDARALLTGYLAEHPETVAFDAERELLAQKELHRLEYGDDGDPTLYPDNTVHELPYLREYERYGGSDGILLAEEQFDASSTLVLRHLCGHGQATQRLVTAFRLMLVAARAFGMQGRQAASYFRVYRQGWARYLPGKQQSAEAQFAARFQRQAPALVKVAQQTLRDPAGEDPAARAWYATLLATRERLAEIDAAKLFLLTGVWQDMAMHLGGVLPYMLFHFLHLTNNRLGILPPEEAYLGFLLEHALAEVEE
jgi:thiopeptide-type bacteriocin biosynthesis protein